MNKKSIFAFLCAVFLLLYLYTLSADWGIPGAFNTWDGLEYTLCSALGGLDHPPVHPFYLAVTRVFCTIVPLFSYTFRMNLFSALFGALTCAVLYLTALCVVSSLIHNETLSHSVAAVTSLVFGLSRVFWSHATITGVQTLNLFLIVVTLYSALQLLISGQRKYLYMIAGLSSLSISVNSINALTFVLPLFLFLMFFTLRIFRIKDIIVSAVLFIAGLLFCLYDPVMSAQSSPSFYSLNLPVDFKPDSMQWLCYCITGKASMTSGMYQTSHLLKNMAVYISRLLQTFTGCTLFFFAAALIITAVSIVKEVKRKSISPETKIMLLLSLLFLSSVIPRLQDMPDPVGSIPESAAGFCLPSFVVCILLAAAGTAVTLKYLLGTAFIMTLVIRNDEHDEKRMRALMMLTFYMLSILPLYLVSTNFDGCNLRKRKSPCTVSRKIIVSLPDRSAVYDTSLYKMLIAYFTRVEGSIASGRVVTRIPEELAGQRLSVKDAGPGRLIAGTPQLKIAIDKDLKATRSVFLSGDLLNENKAPELFLMGDLKLSPYIPPDALDVITTVPAQDLIPYRVEGFRHAVCLDAAPSVQFKGIANDGSFSHILQYLGHNILGTGQERLSRKKLTIECCWKVLEEPGEDYIGTFLLLDERYNKIAPERTRGYFTLGGLHPASLWKKGQIISDEAYFYLPALPPGRYYVALGLLKNDGTTLFYIPGSPQGEGKRYDFMLLFPIVL